MINLISGLNHKNNRVMNRDCFHGDWVVKYDFPNPGVAFLCRYAQYGEVSPKIDVYAFGVVLYELISGKEAIVKTNEIVNESRGLVGLVVIPGPF